MGKSGELGRNREGKMPNKSNLDKKFEEQVSRLEGAQAEMVSADFKTWKWNKQRIHDIQDILEMDANSDPKTRTDLINERHKLITENTSLYSHINRALKGTAVAEDDLDDFCFGK